MEFQGVPLDIKVLPELDGGFIPVAAFFRGFGKTARARVAIAVHRNDGLVSVHETHIHGGAAMARYDGYYLERLLKFLLWQKGGYEAVIYGCDGLVPRLARMYAPGGAREFDARFMSDIYSREFRVRAGAGEPPAECERPIAAGGQTGGCRIGFDAGGSDRKTAAVVDGELVYSEEVVWHPKEHADPAYHYEGILTAFKTAAGHMPRVDAIGVSSAGIYVDNRALASSLFIKVPREHMGVRDIYIRAAAEIGSVPLSVANDGDVAALAGAMELGDTKVLGIAMGTSEAAGYVDGSGCITGWLNELAFAPVDMQPGAAADEWSGDIGCGVKYLSQDAVVRLAHGAGIAVREATAAEKLKAVQGLMSAGDARAKRVFGSVGVYLGHSLALYSMFYDIRHVLLMGRVMSGGGGAVIAEAARRVLAEDYPEACMRVHLPEESSRRVGQAVAAAGLPSV